MSPKKFDEKIINSQLWLALLHLFLDFGNTLYWGFFDVLCTLCSKSTYTNGVRWTDIKLEWKYSQKTGITSGKSHSLLHLLIAYINWDITAQYIISPGLAYMFLTFNNLSSQAGDIVRSYLIILHLKFRLFTRSEFKNFFPVVLWRRYCEISLLHFKSC